MARALYSGVDEYGQPSEVMLGCAIGDIIPHFGTTPPPGTLVCDGSEVSREAYAELYQEIGALCGPGDGSTTFNLPDLRDVWLVWAGTQHVAGEEIAEGLPNITGSCTLHGGDGGTFFDTRYAVGAFMGAAKSLGKNRSLNNVGTTSGTNTSFDRLAMDASDSNTIYGASTHVTPESVAVLPCIVYE